jgi:hypothetical protein
LRRQETWASTRLRLATPSSVTSRWSRPSVSQVDDCVMSWPACSDKRGEVTEKAPLLQDEPVEEMIALIEGELAGNRAGPVRPQIRARSENSNGGTWKRQRAVGKGMLVHVCTSPIRSDARFCSVLIAASRARNGPFIFHGVAAR